MEFYKISLIRPHDITHEIALSAACVAKPRKSAFGVAIYDVWAGAKPTAVKGSAMLKKLLKQIDGPFV